MNNLNSILLEGEILPGQWIEENDHGVKVYKASVKSVRRYKKDTFTETEETTVPIEVYSRLAETCAEYLSAGKGVRVVGRLAQRESSHVVVAEHVEFKPDFKKESA
ncbi:MAG: single-stranded DNA-binding protein [Candidatus Aegiribacteria sp.]|nr:single-stranded DNA-binding protein [Candidatus Aegiribacteria sp.]